MGAVNWQSLQNTDLYGTYTCTCMVQFNSPKMISQNTDTKKNRVSSIEGIESSVWGPNTRKVVCLL